jgi:hypothetical protein
VAGGAAGGGVSSVAGGAAGGGVSSVAGGASAVSPSAARGGNVGQLPLASGVEPSGHDCAYEGCSIDDDCTVRIAAAVTRITLIIIDSLPFISVHLISSNWLIAYRIIYIKVFKGGTDEIILLLKGAN